MRILEVITSLRTGGAERLLSDLVPRLNDSDHKTDILVFDGTKTPFMEKLKGKGVSIYSLNNGTNVYNPRNIFSLSSYLKRYDIVHAHNAACQMYAAIACKFIKKNVFLVTTEHSTDNRRRHIWWFKPIDRWMYHQYDEIVAISDEASRILSEYLGGNIKINTIPNGIDTDKFLYAIPYPECRGCDDVIISMVASFRPQKDQDTLIRSLKYLPNKFKLWLVGDGVRRQDCERLAQSEGVIDRLKFWGIRTDVPNILKTSDIVVLSSNCEGFGLAAVEGMAAGKPVVASDVPGLAQVVEGAGVLFEKKNYKQLAEIILHLTSDEIYRQSVIDKCIERAKEYSIDITASSYLKVYDTLLNA